MPPITSVWPSRTRVSVLASFFAMAGEPVGVGTLSSGAFRCTSICMMMLRSCVMCGVTSRRSTASMNSSLASPFSKVWKGIDTPCSIDALRLSSVTTRGLEITLPSPSLSAASSSRSRLKRSSSRKAPTFTTPVASSVIGFETAMLFGATVLDRMSCTFWSVKPSLPTFSFSGLPVSKASSRAGRRRPERLPTPRGGSRGWPRRSPLRSAPAASACRSP